MQAVDEDGDWPLVFPIHVKEQHEIDLTDADKVVWRDWPTKHNYVSRDDGLVACKIYSHIRARHLWDMIMVSTYDFAEPGFILIDRVNEMNNNWWCENHPRHQSLRRTAAAALRLLPAGLGQPDQVRARSVHRQGAFDWDEYREVVRVFTRMLDNVVEINGLPLEQQRDEIMRKRRHGMGFLGLGRP
jgi:ribonucleoside-diphosphate reductase alpha chain